MPKTLLFVYKERKNRLFTVPPTLTIYEIRLKLAYITPFEKYSIIAGSFMLFTL